MKLTRNNLGQLCGRSASGEANCFHGVAIRTENLQAGRPPERLEAFINRGPSAHSASAASKGFPMCGSVVIDMVERQSINVCGKSAMSTAHRAGRIMMERRNLELKSILGLGLVVALAILSDPVPVQFSIALFDARFSLVPLLIFAGFFCRDLFLFHDICMCSLDDELYQTRYAR